MGNRRETIRGDDAVCMKQTAWELALISVNTNSLRIDEGRKIYA